MLLSREISLLTHPHVSSSWNTALIPEEAESALEAAHYFTEDSSSEGESLLRHLAQPPVCRKPAVPLWAPWEGPATLPGPGWPCRRSHPLFLLHLCLPGPGLLPLPSAHPLLSLPASPLASDLDLFLPWEAQGQSLEGRGDPFASRLCLLLLKKPGSFHAPETLWKLHPVGINPENKLLLVGAISCDG